MQASQFTSKSPRKLRRTATAVSSRPKCPSQVKRLSGQIGHLLHRRRRQHQHMEVAVAGPARGEEVVGLRRLNAAEAGPAALHIDNDRGQICARQIRNALALERDAGTGASSSSSCRPSPSARASINRSRPRRSILRANTTRKSASLSTILTA